VPDVRIRPQAKAAGFRHEAFVYADESHFVAAIADFIRPGATTREPTMVVVSRHKIDLLRHELGTAASGVRFEDMDSVGGNPARILPAWEEFVGAHEPGARLRGVGEPIWPGRSDDELVECHLHESLLNVAFDGGPAFHLVCPYDERALDPDLIRNVSRHHPVVANAATTNDYAGHEGALEIWRQRLPTGPPDAEELRFTNGPLHAFRQFVAAGARSAGLPEARVQDVMLAANEVATNSLLHGGGTGLARIWNDEATFVCEVCDRGTIDDPLVGRRRPSVNRVEGRGLWMANQLCDLVQIRSSASGTVVRLQVRAERGP
jgi:anti-sigma regulatory factor (Ser/Thr protein kinase)